MIQSNDTWDCTRAYQSSVFWRDPFLTRAMENRFNYRLGRVVWVGNRWPKKIYLTDCWPAGNIYIRIFIVHTDPPSCVRDTSATKVRTISRTARNGKIKEEKVWNKDLRMEDGSRSRDRKNRWLESRLERSINRNRGWRKKGAVCTDAARFTVT